MVSRRVRIEGLVQGVGYRAWTARTARALGLTGWVRNRRDGSVEAHFQGPAGKVAEMLLACETGPRSAEVERIEVLSEACEMLADFEVRPTE